MEAGEVTIIALIQLIVKVVVKYDFFLIYCHLDMVLATDNCCTMFLVSL